MWSFVFIFQYDLPQHIAGHDVIQRFFGESMPVIFFSHKIGIDDPL